MVENQHNMKVLVSCGSHSWGGLEMVALQSAEMLQKTGNTVKIICGDNSRLLQEAKSKGFDTIPIYTNNKNILNSISKLSRLLKEFKPDIIHTHLSHDLWVITPAIKRARCSAKLFLTKHMASGVKKTDILHRFLYKRVDGIFSISNYVMDSVVRTCPVPREKLFLMPNGIDLNDYDISAYDKSRIKSELGIPTGRLIISIIGRMTTGKGHEEFLNAAKKINENYNNNVYFLIVGTASRGESGYEKKIRELADTYRLTNLKFTGHVQEIKQILAVTDILAFPSHNESFGVTLIEAMAAGIPAAASGNAGVLDIVTDNVNGLLVQPRDSDSLTAALLKLIKDIELRSRLGIEAKKTVQEKFDINNITQKLLNYYRQ